MQIKKLESISSSLDFKTVLPGVLLSLAVHIPIITNGLDYNFRVNQVLDSSQDSESIEVPSQARIKEAFLSQLREMYNSDPNFLKNIDWFEFYLADDLYFAQTVDDIHVDFARIKFEVLLEILSPVSADFTMLGERVSEILENTSYNPYVVEISSLLVDIRNFDQNPDQETYIGGCQSYAKLLISLFNRIRPDIELRLMHINYAFGNSHVEVVFKFNNKWHRLGSNGFEELQVDESTLVTLEENFHNVYLSPPQENQNNEVITDVVEPYVQHPASINRRNGFATPANISSSPFIQNFPTEQPLHPLGDKVFWVYLPDSVFPGQFIYTAGTSETLLNTGYSFISNEENPTVFYGIAESAEEREERLEDSFISVGLRELSKRNMLTESEFTKFTIWETAGTRPFQYTIKIPAHITKVDNLIREINNRELFVNLALKDVHSEIDLGELDLNRIGNISCESTQLSYLNRLYWHFKDSPFLSKITEINLSLKSTSPEELNQFLGILINFPELIEVHLKEANPEIFNQLVESRILQALYARGISIYIY